MTLRLENLLKAAWFTPGLEGRWGLPILLKGRPGTAKTSRIRQAAEVAGLPCEVVIASLREPADFLGLPVPNEDGQVHYAPPRWAKKLSEKGRGVVFLDELSTAPPAVQAALLRCVLEGWVGDLQLPPEVRFIAAANAVEHSANGYDLSMPLANRFLHLDDMDVTMEDWASWVMSGGTTPGSSGNPKAEEARVMKLWPTAIAKATGLVVAFLKKFDRLLQLPETNNPQASKAWPSPRSWEMCMRAIAGADVHNLSEEETDVMVAGCVGPGAATELAAYRRDVDMPDPAEILDGTVTWVPDARLDRTQAVLSACTALVCPPKALKRDERAKALYRIMRPLVKTRADLVYTAIRALVKAELRSAQLGKDAQECLQAVFPALQASGAVLKAS